MSFVLLLFALALSAIRWVLVCNLTGIGLSILMSGAIVLIGHFFNQLLPTSFGGDAMRGWCLWRQGTTLKMAFASVLLDRLFGLTALLLLVIGGLPLLAIRLETNLPFVLAGGLVVSGAFGLFLLLNLHVAPLALRRRRFWSLFERLSRHARRILGSPSKIAIIMALSLAVHASALYTTALLSNALGAPLTMTDALLIVPSVLVLSALPISIGGWGVREAGLAGGFALIGLDPGIAVTTSILFGTVNILGGVIGGLVFLAMGRPGPVTSEDAS
ncbi:lysylphosphatidylglycerol synthase transmembrane domain-containing protein [Hoeflea alexandrii]|uniref:lysylphosphatidylglycerol synthase transmembrane domain-containing protein n=1 Tax=Hoeflea alexandrii TaxID=288436 RepID=UPI0022B07C03|nr:lysylphosphatidylglycerol synthase transmembrane domain-containing protein [Hoeflea alexandrii]MCZ4291902.1 lysylphosphatidylglycerol synthase transmembrane domain-containing protein [Hoeflea alexandrii]